MSVGKFLAWTPQDTRLWQLIDTAAVLRRGPGAAWPAEPEAAGTGEDLLLDSIGLRTSLDSLCRGTPLDPGED